MRKPARVLVWMTAFLAAVAAVSVLLAVPLREAFLANPVFNGMILAVLAIGIAINYRQVFVLGPEGNWVEAFRTRGEAPAEQRPAQLLGSAARLLSGRSGERLNLSALSLRTLLDGVRARLDESRRLSRYFVGLLVFLGLLGTFWGLLDTLRAVGGVISGLNLQQQASEAFFEQLRSGLQAPLTGMGTAFSSSLFGLAGAVVLGFVDLQAGSAQNRFYNDLEEWLSSQTRLAGGQLAGGEEGSLPGYIQALLEQNADSIEQLQRIMASSEERRRTTDARLAELATELARLTQRLHGELERDREQLINSLREEIRLLTRTISYSRDETPRRRE